MYIIIQNAAHGLHDKGSVNMRALTGLFWMLFVTQVTNQVTWSLMTIDQLQVTIAATFIPITQMMDRKNLYPESIIFGKIWNCQDLSS